MKKIYLFIFLLFASTVAFTQWVWQNPSPVAVRYKEIKFINASVGYLVGLNGIIQKTTDGGENWTTIESGVSEDMNSIYFADDYFGIAVGKAGTIIKTTDGGNNWIKLASNITEELHTVYFANHNTGFVCGGGGKILKTTDGGMNWMISTFGMSSITYISFKDLNNGFVLGDGGKIGRTTDGGITWLDVSPGGIGDFFKCCKVSSDIYMAYVEGGKLFKTTNCGNTWEIISGISLTRNVFFVDIYTGFSVGHIGTIKKTTNGGSSWNTLPSGTYEELLDVCFSDFNNGFVIGENNLFLRTTNGGNSWYEATKGTKNYLHYVKFYNNSKGIAVGANSIYILTTNGGKNWKPKTINGPSTYLTSACYINSTTLFCVGQNSIYKSTDSGENWTSYTNRLADFYSICFPHETTGYVLVFAPGPLTYNNILKTTNSGTSWTLLTSSTNSYLKALYFYNTNIGYAAGENGMVIKTTDGGQHWVNLNSGYAMDIYCIQFLNENTGYACGGGSGYYGKIIKTTNGGISWEMKKEIFQSFESIFFTSINTGYAVSIDQVFMTTDGGENWSEKRIGGFNYLKSIYFSDANHGWVVGGYGSVLNTENGGGLDIEKLLTREDEELLLGNYPNPLNNKTTIRYKLPISGQVVLKVYDFSGREVVTLLNRRQEPGEHEIEFEATNISSGVYYYKLNCENLSETKKMVVIK